ncbi:hypothetical protein GKC44_02370 [Lactobacillus parabuchneri]|uniref:Uncharacterized protein n=1 Tax=Lentilactobacillus parabuchneri TaxID=152331 RepID=A0A844ECX0_9LACO|nr:hypothetical protein [Lentilactobacillus parabuchneri]
MKGKLVKALAGVVIVLFLVCFFFTVSVKNAVRANMMVHGVSPVSAFHCNPKFSPKTSKSLQIPVYYVPDKYPYKDGSTGVRTSTFAIRTYLGIFHVAVTADQYFG